jgi:hypothetical protein
MAQGTMTIPFFYETSNTAAGYANSSELLLWQFIYLLGSTPPFISRQV